jgi:hypothetical protein
MEIALGGEAGFASPLSFEDCLMRENQYDAHVDQWARTNSMATRGAPVCEERYAKWKWREAKREKKWEEERKVLEASLALFKRRV